MTTWYNYFVTNKFSRLTTGHLKSEELLEKILNHNGEEAYACYFDLDYNSLKVEVDTGRVDKDQKPIYEYHPQDAPVSGNLTFTSYEGSCRPALNCVAFDFDGVDDQALNDVRRFLQWLNIDDAVVFFSGSKGFHVLIHFDYFNLSEGPDLVLQLKDLAKYLEKHFPTLDSGIYNYNRKFRVPFTKHDKTGLYKTLIPRVDLDNLLMGNLKVKSETRNVVNFLPEDKPRVLNPQLSEAIEESKRVSYEIEKHKAGSIEKPSPFEAYNNKLCIKKLLESRCDEVGRNNACMRIINDFYRSGLTYNLAEEKIRKWAYDCGLPENEWRIILSDIYEKGKNYNFGCQDEVKSSFCSAKCSIWKKLDPEKRPIVVDAPKSAAVESEKAKRITQKEVAVNLITGDFSCRYDRTRDEYFGGNIIKQDDNIFIYEDGFWQELSIEDTSKIKRRVNLYLEGKATTSQIENIYKMFLIYVPVVPKNVDMFLPRNNIINFSNGVLEVVRGPDYKLMSRFREGHSPTDYLTSKHSLPYSSKRMPLESYPKFHGVLESLFEGMSDKEERIKLVAQMYGAALMPMFPMMFYFYGPAQTGKSTMILILKQLLDEDNLCSVQPKDFHGFELEDMVGKLVNYFTDVNTRKPMDDDIVKVILDRTPVNIRRKNRTSIRACLPSVHLFAGNDLPKSFEVSTAFERRWRLIECLNKIIEGSGYFANADEFAKHIYESEPEGVLNFALYGLDLLLEMNGRFIQVESSKNSMREWQERSDIVSQFIADITTEGVEMDGIKHSWKLEKEGKLNRALCWKVFDAWQEDSIKSANNQISRNYFFVRLSEKGHKYLRSNGHWIKGFALRSEENGSESQDLGQI